MFMRLIEFNKNFNVLMLLVFIVLGMAVCVTEPLSRHCMKLILIVSLFKVICDTTILHNLKEIRCVLFSMVLFFIVMFVSCIYGGNFFEEISKYKFLMHYNALIVPACMLLLNGTKNIKKIIFGMFLGLLLTDAYIFYQSLNGVHRPFSFLKWSIMLGTMLYVILIPAMEILALDTKLNTKERIFCAVCTIISLLAFICLNTRGAWMALFPVAFFILMYYLHTWKHRIIASICVVCCILTGIICFSSFSQRVDSITVTTGKQQSVDERYLMWESAVRMGLDHPIFGVGMGNYTAKYQNEYISPLAKEPEIKHAHNNFFQFFAENGFLGVGAYCIMLFTFYYWSWRRRNNKYAMIIFTSTLALMLYSFTDYTFEGYAGMRVYWLLMGLCFAGVVNSEN